MMRGLLLKTWHEVWLMTLLFGCGLLGVNALLTFVIPQFQETITEVLNQLPFVRPIFAAFLGAELGDKITAQTLQSFLWVHPTVLALLWAHAIVFCTRLPAGEIDRGTIDVLLGLPVSRHATYYGEVIAWLTAGFVILLMGFLGHCLTLSSMSDEMRPPLLHELVVLTNLYCVYVAVGGFSLLVSSLSDRRGRAIATAFAIVLASFLLNFVAQFWEPADQIAFLGVMEYYRPAQIMQSGTFPAADVAVLLSVGATATLLGGEVVARRSICTV
jgi:ABC-type transport system involved in multi-copper enzyme maturation permease subunit